MTRVCAVLLVLLAVASAAAALPPRFPTPSAHAREGAREARVARGVPEPKVFWYDNHIDHFNFMTEPQTFKQRYLVCDEYYTPGSGAPIFFYTGNEGDIEMFYDNTGIMFEWAPKYNALVVFAEHRYYGESMPYGKDSFKPENVGYLSVEQALADYAELMPVVKAKFEAQDSAVIAFGGSYGGMLTAWFRLKYPHVIDGGIAASAPVLQFEGTCDPELFSSIITDDFTDQSPHCSAAIRTSFSLVASLGATEAGRATLTRAFKLCTPLHTAADVAALSNFINQGFTYMAMTDYPYPSNFLQPMPGWPVKVACEKIGNPSAAFVHDDEALLEAVAAGLGVYYNGTGLQTCFNTSESISGGLGDQAWGYQACSELVLPSASDGVHDMFPAVPWDLPAYVAACQKQWDVTARPEWIPMWLGGKNITAGSNIVFSNGSLDPWRGGGIVESLSDTLIAIVIKDGAHHLDLRASNPADPPSVVAARQLELHYINTWIAEHAASLGK